VVGIIGRNGAGKSTLLKVLSRITEPTRGEVTMRGRVSSLLEVGTGFHPELTGRENVYMNGTILGMRKREIDRKFDEIVDFSGVEKFLDTPVKRYSSGMKVRLAFAVAAHLEPEILVIDEVLAVGDFEFQAKCLGKMQDVATGGRTVLFVSHNMAAVESLCTRAIALSDGVLIQDDFETDKVIANYLSVTTNASDRFQSSGRDPGFTPIITDLEFLTREGESVTSVRAGSAMTMRIHYLVEERIKAPTFGLAIDDSRGRRVLWVHSRWQHAGLPSIHGAGTVDCELPALRLLPDRYRVTVSCCEGQTGLDVVPNARSFLVTEADLFGTGKLPPSRVCATYTEAIWNISSGHKASRN
jgi:lipopolysaccharide transport system ATP-binding protein